MKDTTFRSSIIIHLLHYLGISQANQSRWNAANQSLNTVSQLSYGQVNKSIPCNLPLVHRRVLLGLWHGTVFNRINGQLLQEPQVLSAIRDSQEGHKEIVWQRLRLPKRWIITRNHYRVVITKEDSSRMVSSVCNQAQDLVGNRINFHSDSMSFDELQGTGVFRQCISMANSLGSQEDSIDLFWHT